MHSFHTLGRESPVDATTLLSVSSGVTVTIIGIVCDKNQFKGIYKMEIYGFHFKNINNKFKIYHFSPLSSLYSSASSARLFVCVCLICVHDIAPPSFKSTFFFLSVIIFSIGIFPFETTLVSV